MIRQVLAVIGTASCSCHRQRERVEEVEEGKQQRTRWMFSFLSYKINRWPLESESFFRVMESKILKYSEYSTIVAVHNCCKNNSTVTNTTALTPTHYEVDSLLTITLPPIVSSIIAHNPHKQLSSTRIAAAMEDEEDEDAALVDSFFLPGGLLDPEYYDEDEGAEEKAPLKMTQTAAAAAAVTTTTLPLVLPSNPWASDPLPSIAPGVGSETADPLPSRTTLSIPLHHQPPPCTLPSLIVPNDGDGLFGRILAKPLALHNNAGHTPAPPKSSTFRPPPGFELSNKSAATITAPVRNPILPNGPKEYEATTQKQSPTSPEDEEEGDLSQYSIPKELQENLSIASSTSSLSTSTYGKNDAPSTVTAQTEKESIDPEIPTPEESPYTQTSKTFAKLESPAVVEGKSPKTKSQKQSQVKKPRRSRAHKRTTHAKSTPEFPEEDHFMEEEEPAAKRQVEEPSLTTEEPESETATISLEAVFSGVTILFRLAISLVRGVLHLSSSLYNATASTRSVVVKVSATVARTVGRYVAMTLSCIALLYGQATIAMLEDLDVVLCYAFLYLAPTCLGILADLLCAPHWAAQVFGTFGLWYFRVRDAWGENEMETRPVVATTKAKATKAGDKHVTTTHKADVVLIQPEQVAELISIMAQYILMAMVWWDGFSTEFGVLLGLPPSGRLLVAFTICMLRNELSSILLVSWAFQYLMVCWCPSSLVLDQFLMVVGFSSVRMNQQLRKLKQE
jgi:hypothetical protein